MGITRSKMMNPIYRNIPGVAPAVPSASVILMAPNMDYDVGFKVLMVKRSASMKFMPDTYVFPGGKVDESDEALALNTDEVPDVYSHAQFRVAALRELAEEVGVSMDREGNIKSAQYLRFCPASARLLVPIAHWITPIQEKRRYDTFFFALNGYAALQKMPLVVSRDEIADHMWISPSDALKLHEQPGSGFKLPPPTYMILHKLSQYKTSMTAVHEHQIAYGQVMDTEMPAILPIIRVVDGVFESHFPKGMIHLPEGVHTFPGSYVPKHMRPEGDAPLPDFWRVKVGFGSELINPRTNLPIPTIPEGGAPFDPADRQSVHTK